jgi:Co/Zn/Cd efflux system component
MDILNCQFATPVEIASSTWAFSEMNCSSTLAEEISDGTSTFGLVKTFSLGDFFLIFFFVVFALFCIFDFIFRFIYKIKVNFRH